MEQFYGVNMEKVDHIKQVPPSRATIVAGYSSGLSYFVAQSWPSCQEYMSLTMMAPGGCTPNHSVQV